MFSCLVTWVPVSKKEMLFLANVGRHLVMLYLCICICGQTPGDVGQTEKNEQQHTKERKGASRWNAEKISSAPGGEGRFMNVVQVAIKIRVTDTVLLYNPM